MTCVVSGGGLLVIISVVLIMVYLLVSVMPLFGSASLDEYAGYDFPGEGLDESDILEFEEGADVFARYRRSGEWQFFDTESGALLHTHHLPPDWQGTATAISDSHGGRYIVYGSDDGRALILEREWSIGFEDNIKRVTPIMRYPFGEESFAMDREAERPLRRIAVAVEEEGLSLAAVVQDDYNDARAELLIQHYQRESALFGEGATLELVREFVIPLPQQVDFLLLGPSRRYVYVADRDGRAIHYDITPRRESPLLLGNYSLLSEGRLTAMEFLLGGNSVLTGDNRGNIVQWMLVDRGDGIRLERANAFFIQGEVRFIRREHRRKGFLAASTEGYLGIYHATSGNHLLHEQRFSGMPAALAVAPRADRILLGGEDGVASVLNLDNPHPEISWRSLWGKVWYEGYTEPEYVWQSSAASQDFEPKFSLVPLSFGTLKATFYAVLFAVPMALLGAIYTAYFMSPGMRSLVKPTIEIMEALPTVILGFLAGLWLAPYAEENLLGIFLMILLLPVAALLAARLLHYLPSRWHRMVKGGWQAAFLVPVMVLAAWGSVALGSFLDSALFERGFIAWLDAEWDMDFSQRNSVIIGIAMGFAVIPTIFSIAEDAIFSVPIYLTRGSLALGATPWQTLVRVVILTASPGMFSAIMIGLGRVVGETMIVLMATGNTPVMDMNILHGMRTLSANIAIELPEAEVASTHSRVLYLSALVLFLFTFIVNTAGEVVRQHLRENYSRL